MAESKGALIAKSVQKHAGRAKEKLLQNLGKVDRTLDDIFEEHLQNFNRQHQQATRLQKEFNNYIRCIRAVQTASKSLMEAISEVYESGWSGHDLLYVQAQNMEMLWQDFSHKLGDQVLIPLNTYTNQFPETRKKIEKRGRKLVDYDSQRHSFQNLQASASKRRDDVKLTKGREQLEEAKRTYEVLNSELHDELPALHDSRLLFHVTNLQTLFSAEQLFHAETAKVFAELEAITDKQATDCQRGSYTNKKVISNNVTPISSPKTNTLTNSHNGNAASPNNTVQTPPSPELEPLEQLESRLEPRLEPRVNGRHSAASAASEPDDKPAAENGDPLYDIPAGSPASPDKANENKPEENKEKETNKTEENKANKPEEDNKEKDKEIDEVNEKPAKMERSKPDLDKGEDKHENGDKKGSGEEVYDIPVGATLAGLPAGALYRVRATYRYTREDADELSFDVGETIRVVEYDDPDEQEEGWLMGIKETTNEKGMFPANFTRPI